MSRSPMQLTTRYEQTSCRLVLQGLPDLSSGQDANTLGILTGFSLALAGHTELEGKREHLAALIAVVQPYARHLLSGAPRAFGDDDQPVAIAPQDGRHALQLRSSQPNTAPLTLLLDDAELADLVRCLDQLRLDSCVQITLPVPPLQPLRRRDLRQREPIVRRLSAPMAGLAAVAVAAGVALLLPTPKAPPAAPAPSPVTSPERAG